MRTDQILPVTLRIALLIPLAALAACADGGKATADRPGASAAAHTDAAPASAPAGAFVGKVTETMDAGSYTYVEVESGGRKIWAAGPQTAVAVGQEVTIPLEMMMVDFESPSMDRTFPELYFVASFDGGGKPAGGGMGGDPHAGMSMGGGPAEGNPHAGIAGAPAPEVDLADIALPAGGTRIGELWGSRQDLEGQSVTVRGQVVKVNNGIMGRNWMHLRDGSGDAATGTHDLTVTAENGTAAVGDIVTVTGTVTVDKDFGAGYRYDLIVEDASLQAE